MGSFGAGSSTLRLLPLTSVGTVAMVKPAVDT